jgi:hypothetical protein
MMVDATRQTAPLAKLTIMPFGLAPIILVPRHCINAMGWQTAPKFCQQKNQLPKEQSMPRKGQQVLRG